MTIKQILSSENAFYKHQSVYENVTRRELDSIKPIERPIYTHNTESKLWRVVKDIFSIIIFPIGLCRLIHSVAGTLVVQNASLTKRSAAEATELRKEVDLNDAWKVKRISVAVDG